MSLLDPKDRSLLVNTSIINVYLESNTTFYVEFLYGLVDSLPPDHPMRDLHGLSDLLSGHLNRNDDDLNGILIDLIGLENELLRIQYFDMIARYFIDEADAAKLCGRYDC